MFHFKYFIICIFLCILYHAFAEDETLLAPKENIENDGSSNILNGDVTKKLIMWSKGIIPYFIDDFSFDKVTRDKIRLYLSEVGSQTKLQFMELLRPPDDDNSTRWVLLINRIGLLKCDDYYASKFTEKGVQKVVIGYDCLEENSNGLAAAVLALAGVPPEHNSPNRNEFITIEEKNIIPEKLHLFKMIEAKDWPFVNLEYDLNSASHYDYYMYSINGHMTINPKVKPTLKMGGLSRSDILKVNTIYDYISKASLLNDQDCSKMFRIGPKVGKTEANDSDVHRTKKVYYEKMSLVMHKKKKENFERLTWKEKVDYHSDE